MKHRIGPPARNIAGIRALSQRLTGSKPAHDELQREIIALLPRLRRFAYGLSGDLDRADDLVQETCVRALAKSSQWQPGTRLDSWMYRIAQNCWFDQLRARKVRGETVDVDTEFTLAGCDGRDVVEARDSLALVSAKLTSLPRDQQLLVGLVCFDGLSYKDAADTLGIPIGTVMSRLSRARQALAEALDPTPSGQPRTTSDKAGKA